MKKNDTCQGATLIAAQLRELVAGLDRTMFDAYNVHDVDGLMNWFTTDLEFYHEPAAC
jgi:hypothetical protein